VTQIMLAGGKGTLGLGADGILHLVWAPGSMLELALSSAGCPGSAPSA
jgi:hypothetical protein